MAMNKFTARQIKGINTPGRYADGAGLYFVLKSDRGTLRTSWSFLKMVNGRRPDIGLGGYPAVSLADARTKRDKCLAAINAGEDPRYANKAKRAAATFGEMLTAAIEKREGAWKNPKTKARWIRTLDVYAKRLKNLPVDTVSTDDVMSILRPLWVDRHPTAKKMQKHIEAAFDIAIIKGERSDTNPAKFKGGLEYLLPDVKHKEKPHASLDYELAPGLMSRMKLRAAETFDGGSPRLLMFAFASPCRISEARLSRWRDYDLEARIWTIQPENEKLGQYREVPLSDYAIELLGELGDPDDYAFPGAKVRRPFSDATVRKMLRTDPVIKEIFAESGEWITVHGSRATFRTWAQEKRNEPREVCERALGHVIGNKVERSYARSNLIEKQDELLSAWAAFLFSGSV